MDNGLKHYQVVAERYTGFWLDQPVDTGLKVPREEWLRLMQDDPEHFQMVTLLPEDQLPTHSKERVLIAELAISVRFSDEPLQ